MHEFLHILIQEFYIIVCVVEFPKFEKEEQERVGQEGTSTRTYLWNLYSLSMSLRARAWFSKG